MKDRCLSKVGIRPVKILQNTGFTKTELEFIKSTVVRSCYLYKGRWFEYFRFDSNASDLENRIRFHELMIIDNFIHIQPESGKAIKRNIKKVNKLSKASTAELLDYDILGDGEGVFWPSLDVYLSAAFLILNNRFPCKWYYPG